MTPIPETCTVTFLYTTDVHGNVYPRSYADGSPSPTGLARLAPLIRRERSRDPHALLIDNGDLIQGTPFTYHYAKFPDGSPNPMMRILNALGYDAAVPGNHEFNYGVDFLNEAVGELRAPYLCANILDAGTGEPYFGRPYLVRELPGGVRVGVLGLTTPYIPNWEHAYHIEGLVFEDAVVSAQRWVRHLRESEAVDVVAVSYHGGFERRLETGEPSEPQTGENQGWRLCAEVPGIDLLLTGHQHREIGGRSVNGVWTMQAGGMGKHLGKATISLERAGNRWRVYGAASTLLLPESLQAYDVASGRPLPVREYAVAADIAELAAPYEERTQRWLDQPIGEVEGDMTVRDPMGARLREHPYIELLNRVQMDAADCDISCTALFDDYSPGFGSRITMREIVANYIYPNTLKVLRVSGQDIRDALERSAAYFALDEDGAVRVSDEFADPKPQPYNYDMWEGVDYTLDIAQPLGSRVVRLEREGRPLPPDGEFDVVMNNYRSVGGGEYPMFKDKPIVREIAVDVSELLANYILQQRTVVASVNDNWRVVADGREPKRRR